SPNASRLRKEQTTSSPDYQPGRKEKVAARGCQCGWKQRELRAWQLEDDLRQIHLPLRHLVLQRRGQLIDIPRSNVYRHMIGQQRSSIAAHGVAPHLNQQ